MKYRTKAFWGSCFLLPLLIGCSSTAQKNKAAIDEAIPGKSSSFKNMKSYPGNVTCGQYLGMGESGFPDYRHFVVVDTVADTRPSKLDIAVFCSDDPKAALNDAFKIDFDAQQPSIEKVLNDFERLKGPLLAYEKDNTYFPFTEQGLQGLIEPKPWDGAMPRNFKEGGYIDRLPVDPWNRDYIYRCDGLGGIRIHYSIKSLGEDGKFGGEGANADISTDQAKYFKHILNL